jgi:hypothetical protein
MKPNKKEKLKNLLQKLESLQGRDVLPDEGIDSLIKQEVENISAKLSENPTIKILQKFSGEISKFKKDFDLKPITEAIKELEQEIKNNQESALFEYKLELQNKVQELMSLIPKFPKIPEPFDSSKLEMEISVLRQQFLAKRDFDATPLQKSLTDLKNDFKAFTIKSDDSIANLANKELLEGKIELVRKEFLNRLNNIGGGSMNQKISINSSVMSTQYADFNLKQGAGVTISKANNQVTKQVDITISSAADLSVTLADVSANSITAPDSLYTMTATVPVIFKSGSTNLLYLDNTNNRIGIGNTPTSTFQIYEGSNLLAETLGVSTRSRMQMFGKSAGSGSALLFFDGPDGNNAAYAGYGIDTTNNTFGVAGTVFASSSNGTGTTQPMIFVMGASEAMRLTTGKLFGLGTGATVSAKFHVISTTEQFRSGYDASNFWNATTGSTGITTFDATSSTSVGAFNFSDPVGIGDTAPVSHAKSLSIIAGTITDQIPAIKLTGTIPSGSAATYNTMVQFQVTSADNGQNQYPFNMELLAGGTDAVFSAGGRFASNRAGTGSTAIGSFAGSGNAGLLGYSDSLTSGFNAGGYFGAFRGNTNAAVVAFATTAKNSATNIGVLSYALNTGTSPIHVAGYFGLNSSTPTFASAALMCDNAATTSDIFVARNEGTASFVIGDSDLVDKYKQITTAGWGIPAIYGSARSTAQSGDVASVATYTCGAADGSFIVSCNANCTAFTAGVMAIQCTYTDETNTARTLVLSTSNITGTIGTSFATTGAFEGLPLHIRVKASTAITIKTVGTAFTGIYNVEGAITQIA